LETLKESRVDAIPFDLFVEIAKMNPMPKPEISGEEYLMMCMSMEKDPFNNTITLILEKETGFPITKRTEYGPALVAFAEPKDVMDFVRNEMPRMGLTMETTWPCPIRACVEEDDNQLRAMLETVQGSFRLKEINEYETGTMYVTEGAKKLEDRCQRQPGLFGSNKIGEA
jgi:hypothetical protein